MGRWLHSRWLLMVLGGAAGAGCGHFKPKPPPAPASCVEACRNVTLTLACPTTMDDCQDLCTAIEPNQPGFPRCVNAATSCAEADDCQK